MSESRKSDVVVRFVSQADLGKLASSAFLYERDADEAAFPIAVTHDRLANASALSTTAAKIHRLNLAPVTDEVTPVAIVELSSREAAVLDEARQLDAL